jgi:hypothetical protein
VTRIGIGVCILHAKEGAGAVLALFNLGAGRGGSDTSDSVRSGIGANAGGCAGLLMICRRSPGRAGDMKVGVFFPMFMHLFAAKWKPQREKIYSELQGFYEQSRMHNAKE